MSGTIRLREAVSVYSEVEQTAAEIRRLLASGDRAAAGTLRWPPGIWPTTPALIETVFERYEIPVYLSRRSDILEKSGAGAC